MALHIKLSLGSCYELLCQVTSPGFGTLTPSNIKAAGKIRIISNVQNIKLKPSATENVAFYFAHV